MRNHLAPTHGEGEVEEHADTPGAMKDAVMQTEDHRRRRREELDAMRATCYARLVIRLEQRQQEQAMKIQMQYQIQHFHNQGMTPQQIAQVSIDHGMFFHHWPAHTLFLLASRWAMA